MCRIVWPVVAALLLPVLGLSCGKATMLGYGDDGGTGAGGELYHPSEVSVAYLRSLAAGLTYTIKQPLSVKGRVTAADTYGELYKTIHIEDSTGGMDVAIDCFSLYSVFALYDEVRIECHGLALGRYGSRIELGLPPTGEYTVDRIPESEIGKYMTIDKTVDDRFEPLSVTIPELEPSLVGRTVKIGGLHMAAGGSLLSWCDFDPLSGGYADTERRAEDESGNRLAVFVRGGCMYAGDAVPEGRFELCGIVEYRSGAYALRITNRNINVEYD